LALAVIAPPEILMSRPLMFVITAPRTDLAFDLADLGADRLEASPDCSQRVSAAQRFAQQARCSRVPAKCSGLDLTSAENLS